VAGSDDADAVPVLVTVTSDRRPDTSELAERMREAGMTVDTVLATVGVVTGTATPTQAAAVAAMPGVAAVEPDRTVHTGRAASIDDE
jgi:hypothetical protein